LECWNDGRAEYWGKNENIDLNEIEFPETIIPVFHYSNIPADIANKDNEKS
jgi:hypothetical protein